VYRHAREVHVFLDGEFVPRERAMIPIDDRAFLYGDGLFETVPVHGGVPFRWEAHMERLWQGFDLFRLKLGYTGGQLLEFAQRLVKMNRTPECVLRVTVSRGSPEGSARAYSIRLATKPRVLMTMHPLPNSPRAGWKLVTSSWRVLADDPLMRLKTSSKVRSVLARAEAEEHGADEALLLNERGEITEGAATNFFCIRNGQVMTPPLGTGLLPGVTRAAVFEMGKDLGVPICEGRIVAGDLGGCEGAFVTVSTLGVVEVVSVDGVELRRSKMTERLREGYRELVERETGRERLL
jgi:branched-subunit amino acid aminotransferase/4-amino-4-deoxychorismate lyase